MGFSGDAVGNHRRPPARTRAPRAGARILQPILKLINILCLASLRSVLHPNRFDQGGGDPALSNLVPVALQDQRMDRRKSSNFCRSWPIGLQSNTMYRLNTYI